MASIVGSLRQDHINSTMLLDVLEQQLVTFSGLAAQAVSQASGAANHNNS